MTIKERMNKLVELEGLNPNQFYNISGLGNGYLDKIGHTLRRPTIEKLTRTFPHWNLEWIRTGEGDMIVEVKPKEVERSSATSLNIDHMMLVPLVNQYAYAGYISGYGDEHYMETLPTIPFIIDHEARGNYIAFEVRGDSMNDGTEDSYVEGDRVLCREIASHLWMQSKLHHRKWDFIIVLEDGILLKRIIDHNIENQTITIHSLNEMYEDRIISTEEIKQIFNVVELQRPRRR